MLKGTMMIRKLKVVCMYVCMYVFRYIDIYIDIDTVYLVYIQCILCIDRVFERPWVGYI